MGKNIRRYRLISLTKLFPEGARKGMLVFFCMFVLSLLWNSGFSVMGVTKNEVAKLVITSFWPWVLMAQVKLLFAYLVIGYAAGLTAELVAEYFFHNLYGIRVWWVLAVNTYFLLINIRKYPQLYTESLYDHGGILKFLQLLVTDKIPQPAFNALGLILLAVTFIAFGIYIAKRLRERIYLASLAIVVAVFAVLAMYHPKIMSSKNKGPNVIVLAADSFRRDRLGSSKYLRPVTPNIDKLADEGVTFNKEFTSFPRTFPAIISILTGRFPVSHGVRHMFPDKYLRDHAEYSLAEALRKNGYATGVVSDFAGDVFSRMKIGFDTVHAPYFNFITLIDQRCLEGHFLLMPYLTNPLGRKLFPELLEFADNGDPFMLADEVTDTLADLTSKDKFFCFVFFSDIHFPYAAPYPYYQKYTDPAYKGRFKYHKPPAIYSDEQVTAADITQIQALYDGSVQAYDCAVGKIVDYLKKRGCYENTIIIITADHGENLYENDWYIGHGEHLRGDKVLNVPLIIKFPDGKYKGEINCLTRDIDLSPTLRAYLGLPIPAGIDGENLMPIIEGKIKDLGLLAFAETGVWFSDTSGGFFQKERIMYPDITAISTIDFTYNLEVVLKKEYEALVRTAKHRMVDDGHYRLIYVPERQGIKYELYDTLNDKKYAHDISAQNVGKVNELKKKLFEFMAKDKSIVFKNGFAVQER